MIFKTFQNLKCVHVRHERGFPVQSHCIRFPTVAPCTLPNIYINYASDTLHRYDIDDRCILLGFDSFLDRFKKWQYVCYWIILSYYAYLQSIYYMICHYITINWYLCLLIRYHLSNVVTCVGVHWSSVYDRPRMLHLVVLLISASSLLWRLVYATLRSMCVLEPWFDIITLYILLCFVNWRGCLFCLNQMSIIDGGNWQVLSMRCKLYIMRDYRHCAYQERSSELQ